MELLNFRLYLNQSETSYSFDDVQVKLIGGLVVTIEGNLEIEFSDEQGTINPDSLDYFVDTVEIDIETVYDEEDNVIGFASLMVQLKQEIENAVISFTIENH